ncbi:MAG: S41 family peptidase, partial [bacterium]
VYFIGLIFLVNVGAFGAGYWSGAERQIGVEKKVAQKIEVNSTSTPVGQVENINTPPPAFLSKDVDFKLFWQTWELVKSNYYQKNVPDTKLFYGALQGMVASLGDPYTVFMTPQESQDFKDSFNGSFEGIGAEISIKNNVLTIVTPLPDTPADKAKLRAGDIITKINGKSTENMSVNTAVSLIRGKKGTAVTLAIFRTGFDKPRDFAITRDAILVKSVSLEYKEGGDVAYIKVRQFNDDTMPLLDEAIANIEKRSVKGIILDLRNNPGGYLESAIEMSSEWIGNKISVSEKSRDGLSTDHRLNHEARLDNYSTVVLVNQGSASASEIVSGALKDWGKAKIVGMKTFGKGSVQNLLPLGEGSSLKVTIAKWFTPKGVSIQDEGITPDVVIDLTEKDYNENKDPQLDKAIEIIKPVVTVKK